MFMKGKNNEGSMYFSITLLGQKWQQLLKNLPFVFVCGGSKEQPSGSFFEKEIVACHCYGDVGDE